MIATPYLPAVNPIQVDTILADAVTLNWSDLMPDPALGLIHVEYHVEPLGSVEFVKVWASTTRGYWNLVCEHWMRWGTLHQSGLHFRNNYQSSRLATMLETIMQHQEVFRVGTAPNHDRMIQVKPPTDTDKAAALATMKVFRERLAA